MSQTAYVDTAGDVVLLSSQLLSLAAAQAIDATVTAVVPSAPDAVICSNQFQARGRPAYYHRKTSGDGTSIGHYSQIERLAALKQYRFAGIDTRTDELIAEGFTYASEQFSLSLKAQNRMMGTHQVKSGAGLVYPIEWNTIDDTDMYSIPDATDLAAFYLTGLEAYRAHVDSGTALKTLVRAAATEVAINAVVDSR